MLRGGTCTLAKVQRLLRSPGSSGVSRTFTNFLPRPPLLLPGLNSLEESLVSSSVACQSVTLSCHPSIWIWFVAAKYPRARPSCFRFSLEATHIILAHPSGLSLTYRYIKDSLHRSSRAHPLIVPLPIFPFPLLLFTQSPRPHCSSSDTYNGRSSLFESVIFFSDPPP